MCSGESTASTASASGDGEEHSRPVAKGFNGGQSPRSVPGWGSPQAAQDSRAINGPVQAANRGQSRSLTEHQPPRSTVVTAQIRTIPNLAVCDRPTVDPYPSAWPDVQHHIQQPVRYRAGSNVYQKDGE